MEQQFVYTSAKGIAVEKRRVALSAGASSLFIMPLCRSAALYLRYIGPVYRRAA